MGVAAGMTDTWDIAAVRARLESAADLRALMAASWAAFEFLRASAGARANPGAPAYAAQMEAAAAAASARDFIGWAPSMPGEPDAVPRQLPVDVDPAATLAGLAGHLAARLEEASETAELDRDRDALSNASFLGGLIADLLAGES